MIRLSPRLLCQIYGILVLLAATITSGAPYFMLALTLLLVMLFIALRPLSARYNVVIIVVTLFLLPLVITPMLNRLLGLPLTVGQIVSAVSVLPIIYLLDSELKQTAQQMRDFNRLRTEGRHTTTLFRTFFTAMLVMLPVSIILGNPALLFTGIIFALYLLGVLIRILFTVPRFPLDAISIEKRVITGTTVNISLDIVSRASVGIQGVITPVDSWVKIMPQEFILNGTQTSLDIIAAPPLAGPVRPQFRTSVVDPRGFIQINQQLEPVELSVIPRARYAEWLVMKYLEQTGDGVITATRLAPKATVMPKGGVEYHDSRSYQPGDRLKDVDWKHTIKLSKLIVKEYVEAGERAVIIAVNLSVTDAEEADKLAFKLLTVALTLAREGIPAALAAYNYQRVVLTTAVTNPREILKRTLSLVKDIAPAEFVHRCLKSPDIAKLRRNIIHLKQSEAEPARRLLEMLNFECRAMEEAARTHPATVAISMVSEHAPTPAMIILLSRLNHDTEAIAVTTERLSKREFTIIAPQAAS